MHIYRVCLKNFTVPKISEICAYRIINHQRAQQIFNTTYRGLMNLH